MKSETSEFPQNEDCFYSSLRWPPGIVYAIISIIKLQRAQVSSFHSFLRQNEVSFTVFSLQKQYVFTEK